MMKVFRYLLKTICLCGIVTLCVASRLGGRSTRKLSAAKSNSIFDFFNNISVFESQNLTFKYEKSICDFKMPTNCACDELSLRRLINRTPKGHTVPLCLEADFTVTKEIDLTNKAVVIQCRFTKNSVGDETSNKCRISGAGNNRIFTGSPTRVELDDITFDNGYTNTDGGVALFSGGDIIMWGVDFRDSTAGNTGGAIALIGSTVNVQFNLCNFESNSAATGGAVSVQDGARIELLSNHFVDNTATQSGAAVSVNMASVMADDVYFSSNLGGALQVTRAEVELLGAVFQGNQGGDIEISDDADPAAQGSLVQCKTSKNSNQDVQFCDGLDGITEDTAGAAQRFANTNCKTASSIGGGIGDSCLR
jgi:hypothetical protein